jgi:hypothetical protein
MKKLALALSALLALLFSVHALPGVTLGNLGNLDPSVTTPNPVLNPDSKAYGKSLDAWVEAYLRTVFEGAAAPVQRVAFLPVGGESPFEVEVKPGTTLVLPIALWLGFATDPVLGSTNFFGEVTLDGQPIAVPNEDYYVGPTYVDPPILGVVTFFEGLAVMIKPLLPGEHTIELYSTINTPDGLAEFSNIWNITVTP